MHGIDGQHVACTGVMQRIQHYNPQRPTIVIGRRLPRSTPGPMRQSRYRLVTDYTIDPSGGRGRRLALTHRWNPWKRLCSVSRAPPPVGLLCIRWSQSSRLLESRVEYAPPKATLANADPSLFTDSSQPLRHADRINRIMIHATLRHWQVVSMSTVGRTDVMPRVETSTLYHLYILLASST